MDRLAASEEKRWEQASEHEAERCSHKTLMTSVKTAVGPHPNNSERSYTWRPLPAAAAAGFADNWTLYQ